MNSFRRYRHAWLGLALLIVAVPVYYGYTMADTFLWSQQEIHRYFKGKTHVPVARRLVYNGMSVEYMTAGADSLPVILFIHGAPGGWTDYIRYFADSTLLQQARLIAYDRPGYGLSGCGQPVTSLDEQASVAQAVLQREAPHRPFVAVGHSYGGPIAARLAMRQPSGLLSLVLIAPAIDPDNEKQFFVNRVLTAIPALQRLLPCSMFSAYREKMTHESELRLITGDWNRIQVPTFYMYGNRDQLVPPVNVDFAQKNLQAPLHIVRFPNGNHFLPWNQPDSVRAVLLRALQPYF
ncbi:MAG: alpha/beta hydrolase [Chitinophagales bacterium]|nr:alpha/beta hydrolase [Chitinophagales bacterium]MDW8394451.1 alpha/beta hydrolase [Chitinophagales bacterium]